VVSVAYLLACLPTAARPRADTRAPGYRVSQVNLGAPFRARAATALLAHFELTAKPRFRAARAGGWLVLEPFISPGIFEEWRNKTGFEIIDEYTLCQAMGDEKEAALTVHYETFIVRFELDQVARCRLTLYRLSHLGDPQRADRAGLHRDRRCRSQLDPAARRLLGCRDAGRRALP